MSTNPTAETCGLDTGCIIPGEFVRLRYFFGQRLGAMELTDEQAYVVGKQRFHNQRLHGAGVLCGLRVECYAPAGQETTTLLKVTSGAAIDACGREILVGWDSCIDVAAWVRKHRESNPDLADPTQPSAQRVWVILCYQECPSDPSPAPWDPCGCEAAGCEYSRVREGFRLDLVTESDLPGSVVVSKTSDSCPVPPSDACLVLARVDLALDDQGDVSDLTAIEHAIPQRAELWSTAAIQAALSGVIDPADLAAALAGGPRFGELVVAENRITGVTLLLPVLLADDSTGKPSLLLGDPTECITVVVRQLQGNGAWSQPLKSKQFPSKMKSLRWNEEKAQLEINFPISAPGRYHLSLVIAADTPIVDAAHRELLPRAIGRWFQVESGVITRPSLHKPSK